MSDGNLFFTVLCLCWVLLGVFAMIDGSRMDQYITLGFAGLFMSLWYIHAAIKGRR